MANEFLAWARLVVVAKDLGCVGIIEPLIVDLNEILGESEQSVSRFRATRNSNISVR